MRFVLALSWYLQSMRQLRWPAVFLAVLVVAGFTAVAPAQKPVPALPQIYIDTTWNPPIGGTTWAAHTAAQLTSAIAHSSPGDVIVLDAGVTYTGNFTLSAKSNPINKWIYIMSSALAKMPAGTRVSPSQVANMPKIVTPNGSQAFAVVGGTNHWRLAGLEITSASTQGCGTKCFTYFLIGASTGLVTPEPDSITVDRCYLHGSSAIDVREAVQANASNYAVIDSYIDEIHQVGAEAQGIIGYTTPGPIKIVNNYIAAATENIMFGGAGGWNNPYIPSDIEIRNNYLFKPLSWVALSVTQKQMVVKNAFELKSAQRVLFDSNTIENVWANGQNGFAIVLTVRSSQSGDISVVNDVTITNNVLKNVVSGFNTLAKDDACGATWGYPNCHNSGSQDRWYIANNLMTFYDPTSLGGLRNEALMVNGGQDRIAVVPGVLRDVVFQHNTTVSAASTPCWMSIFFSDAPIQNPVTSNIWILDNALCRQPSGDNSFQGTSGLTQYMGYPSTPPYDLTRRYYGNVMYVPRADKVQVFPPHNYATTVPFAFVNPAAGNFQLLTPYWTDTSDGKLAGTHLSPVVSRIGPSAQNSTPDTMTTATVTSGLASAGQGQVDSTFTPIKH
jgi:hypothetical protein